MLPLFRLVGGRLCGRPRHRLDAHDRFNPNSYLPFAIPGLGVVILALALTLIGFLTANYLGRHDAAPGQIGVVGADAGDPLDLLGAVKQTSSRRCFVEPGTVLQRSGAGGISARRQCGRWSALVVGKACAWRRSSANGSAAPRCLQRLISRPRPIRPPAIWCSVARAQMIHLDMTVEDCLKMIISGGIVTPRLRGSPSVRAKHLEGADSATRRDTML